MSREYRMTRTLYEKEIVAVLTCLDEGIHVLLTGGDRSHVGAAYADPSLPDRYHFQIDGHREGAVAEAWVKTLSAAAKAPVCAVCDIHYDRADRAQIDEILAVCGEMLGEAAALLKNQRHETTDRQCSFLRK